MGERLFVRNKADWEKVVNTNYHIEKLPEVFEVQNGIVLPCKGTSGGVCDSEFNFKGGLFREYRNPPGWGGIGSAYTVDKSSLKSIDEIVVFGGVLLPHFGHMILDSLTRLWWHVENPNSKLRFVFVLNVWGWKDYLWEFFDLLGIARERILFIEQPTQFAKIIVPEEAAHSWVGYTDKWECVYNFIVKNVLAHCSGETLPKKIYISKSNYNSGGSLSINESYYEEWYRQHGYEVIIPELLPLYKQIALVANAEAIATTLGTTSHFNLFAKPNTRIDIITRVDHQTIRPQCLINQMKQADYYFIDGSLNFLPCERTIGNYFLGITDCWKDYVKQIWSEDLGDKETDAELYLKYAVEWTKFFCDNPNKFKHPYFQDLDFFDILERMARILLGRKIERKQYNDISKSQLRKERDEALKKLGEEKDNGNKEIAWFKGVTDKLQDEMQVARLTYLKNEEQFKIALKKSEDKLHQERQSRLKSEREKTKLLGDYYTLRNSLSFKVGRMITFFPRKLRNLFKKKKA